MRFGNRDVAAGAKTQSVGALREAGGGGHHIERRALHDPRLVAAVSLQIGHQAANRAQSGRAHHGQVEQRNEGGARSGQLLERGQEAAERGLFAILHEGEKGCFAPARRQSQGLRLAGVLEWNRLRAGSRRRSRIGRGERQRGFRHASGRAPRGAVRLAARLAARFALAAASGWRLHGAERRSRHGFERAPETLRLRKLMLLQIHVDPAGGEALKGLRVFGIEPHAAELKLHLRVARWHQLRVGNLIGGDKRLFIGIVLQE